MMWNVADQTQEFISLKFIYLWKVQKIVKMCDLIKNIKILTVFGMKIWLYKLGFKIKF